LKVVIINTIQDALHHLNSRKKQGLFNIFTTHDSVQDFLESKEIFSQGLMEFVSEKQVLKVAESVRIKVPYALNELDEKFSERLSLMAEIPVISWFNSAYRYHSEFEFFGLTLAHKAIQNIISKINPKSILIYDPGPSPYLGEKFGFTELVKHLERILPVKVETSKGDPHIPIKLDTEVLPWRLRLENSLKSRTGGFMAGVRNYFRRSKHICISFQGKRDWPWREKDFPLSMVHWDAVVYSINHSTGNQIQDIRGLFEASDNSEFKDKQPDNALLASMLKGVKENLRKNFVSWTSRLRILQYFIDNNSVRLATWKMPPVEGGRALANELISTNDIQIIGSQHGGCYGIQEVDDIHQVSDYSRCNYFLSHGFKRKHLSFKKKGVNIPQIIPTGGRERVNSSFISRCSAEDKIEILYPIGNCHSFWFGLSFVRIKADILFDYQKYILDKLAKFDGKILVKLPPGANRQTFSNWERLRESGIKVFTGRCDLESVMEYYQPRNVFLDILSTPLIEVLQYDCEVFQINDPVCPLKSNLHQLLAKRVHLCSDAKSLFEKFESVNAKPSMALRDDGFYNQFVRPNSQGRKQLKNHLLEIAK